MKKFHSDPLKGNNSTKAEIQTKKNMGQLYFDEEPIYDISKP